MNYRTRLEYRMSTAKAIGILLDEPSLASGRDDLAKQVGLSPFHFHRAFKYVCGEGPNELSARLLLERAAWQLKHTRMSVSEIALEAGFESLAGFSRSFRKGFGVSPSIFRIGNHPSSSLQSPNNIHYRRNVQGWAAEFIRHKAMNLEVKSVNPIRICSIQHLGPYYLIGETCAKLGPLASHLPFRADRRMFAVYRDDPLTTPISKLHSEAGFELFEGETAPEGTQETTIPGGKCATYLHEGPYDVLGEVWGEMARCLAGSEMAVRQCPTFDVYLDCLGTLDGKMPRTELYWPIC